MAWTSKGLVLLAVSFVLIWVPLLVAGVVAALMALAGVVLLALGREVFGPRHARNVSLSIGLIIVGVVGSLIALAAAVDLVLAAMSQDVEAFVESLGVFLVLGTIFGLLGAIGTLVLPYALQDRRGRRLLWLALLATVLTQGAILAYGLTVTAAGATVEPEELQGALGQIEQLGYLHLVPALLNAWAYGHAWSRLRAGEVPERPPLAAPG